MNEQSKCCNKPVRVEPADELEDPIGKTFWYVCTECGNSCDVIKENI